MNFLSKLTLMVTLSTAVCSSFAMDTVSMDMEFFRTAQAPVAQAVESTVEATVEGTAKAIEFVQENPAIVAGVGLGSIIVGYLGYKIFGGSKAKEATPNVPVVTQDPANVQVQQPVITPAPAATAKTPKPLPNKKSASNKTAKTAPKAPAKQVQQPVNQTAPVKQPQVAQPVQTQQPQAAPAPVAPAAVKQAPKKGGMFTK